MNKGIIKVEFDDLLSMLNVNGFDLDYVFLDHTQRYLGIVVEHKDLPYVCDGAAIPYLTINTFWNSTLNFATSVDLLGRQINCTHDHVVNSWED